MNAEANTTVSHFQAGTDTVTDARTSLTWSHTLGEGNFKKAEKLIAEANKMKLGGFDDWRLPTVEELFCLADRSRHSPAIDTNFFPDTKSDWYWTSSSSAFDSGGAWVVGFSGGGSSGFGRSGSAFVRAVRSARQ